MRIFNVPGTTPEIELKTMHITRILYVKNTYKLKVFPKLPITLITSRVVIIFIFAFYQKEMSNFIVHLLSLQEIGPFPAVLFLLEIKSL